MCTLALFFRTFDDAPVVIAANRDENPRRPSTEPRRWPDEPEGIFAGQDLVSGGTWLGVNRHRVICGITNRWGQDNDPTRSSRGLIVRDALRAPSASAAAEALSRLSPGATNAFGLLVADLDHAFRVDCGASVEVRALAPGITVLANWGAGERMPRSDRALALAQLAPTSSFERALPDLERLVADHEGAETPGQAICAHGERYATVSSTIVSIGRESVRWRDCRGNPCTAEWVERAALQI